jgi:c-di-GMP-binding flagellar brake protein YcgR
MASIGRRENIMDTSESAWVELPDLERAQPSTTPSNAGVAGGNEPGTGPATIRRSPVREIASWRVLKMWEDGASLADAVTVKLIGVHESRSLIVTAPGSAEGLAPAEGGLYRFRSFSGESIYEFSALLLKRCDEPYPYLHLAWPLERHVRNRDLRAAVRVKTDLPCTVHPVGAGQGCGVDGVITNLSTGGAGIRLSGDLQAADDEVRIVFRLHVAGHEIAIDATARPVRKPDNGAERAMGVSFSDLALAEQLALHAFVNAQVVRELEVPLYAS